MRALPRWLDVPLTFFGLVLRAAFALFVLVVLLLVMQWHYKSVPHGDSFYLRGAGWADPGFVDAVRARLQDRDPDSGTKDRAYFLYTHPAFYVHRIGAGNGVVLAWRWYSDGDPADIDDESFRKITIIVPAVPAGAVTRYTLGPAPAPGVAQAYYSQGGSAWTRTACTYRVDAGTVEVEALSARYAVRIRGALTPLLQSAFFAHCKNVIALDESFVGAEMRLDELTPWLGGPGPPERMPYAETFR